MGSVILAPWNQQDSVTSQLNSWDLHLRHTDLKPENILLASPEHVKVPDYEALDPLRKQKTRGGTRYLDIWGMQEGECITVPLNGVSQPIGKEGGILARFLGTVAQKGDLLPLTYCDWSKIPDTYLEEKFDFPQFSKDWVLQSTTKRWKDWKAQLKRKVTGHMRLRLADWDDRVLPDQWWLLVHFWNSAKGWKRVVLQIRQIAPSSPLHILPDQKASHDW